MASLEPKVPSEVRNYTFDWSAFLGTDTIATSDVTVAGVTLEEDTNDTTSVTVLLSGGTLNTVATITNTITTTGGLTETQVFTLLIAPDEPVSVDVAKAHLRVETSAEDALIASWITMAREWVEDYSDHILVRREVSQAFDGFSTYFELSHRPIIDVATIAYVDADGADQELADFAQTTGRYPFRVYPDEQPATETYSSVTVTYTAGYGPGEEPQKLIQAMLVLIAGMHANRGSIPDETARTAAWLCDQHRPVL